MTVRLVSAVATTLAVGSSGPALAHHSTEVFFDRTRTVEFVGILQKLDMINPHAWFHFQEIMGDGQIKAWRVEADPPNLIRRGTIQQFGFSLDFETGKKYTVRIEPSWDNTTEGYLKSLILPDGSVFTCC